MSKLDEMIRELCPDGVEYKRFDEVCTLNARIGWQRLTKAEYMSKGDYLLITGTDFTETHEIDYSTCVYVTEERYKQDLKIQLKNGDVLITKDGTLGKVAQVKGLEMPATLNGGVFVVRCKDSSLENRFILHYLLSNHFQSVVEQQKTGSTISHLTQTLFSRLMIPIPPLEIQREIVRILDNFTKLTAELTVELTARKTQYDFYRDKLLTFESKIQLLSLKDIAKFSYGYTDKAQEHGDTRFLRITDISEDGTLKPDGAKYIQLNEESRKYLVKKGDLLLARTGATYGKTLYVPDDSPAVYASFLIKIELDNSKILNRYYWHFSKSNQYWRQAEKLVSKGGQQQFNTNAVERVVVPVPPLDVQNRIVNVLDNFEKICSDLNIGLPAEIEARQKQYEYYRDKLLTFAENGNTILSRAEQSRAEQSRAEQSRAEQSRAEQSRALIKLVQYVYGCVWLELGDMIVSLNTGLNPRKFFKLNTEDATNYYITIREMKDGKIVPSEKTDRMNDEARKLCNNRSNLEVGDVLFSGTGTIGETAVIEKEPSNWNIKEGVYAIKPNQTMIQPMYLRYILMTDFIKKEYMKKAAGGTVQSVPMGELKKIRIPVPSLQEQNRITEVLKQLDDLCNDLTSGLPAEIEARQKQYEYYRDKLLTFKEVAAT